MPSSNLGFHLLTTHKIAYYNKPKAGHLRFPKVNALYMCVDINCFYAQVEMRRNCVESYPVSIGGWRDENGIVKGIVATSNYAARAYGVKTGMSSHEAVSLCPHLIMFPVDYEYYVELSDRLHEIFKNYSHQVEMYSIDEAFLDMTGHVKNEKDAKELIMNMKAEIWQKLKLTVSVGLSFTKTYAKLLADLKKPDGKMIVMNKSDIFKIVYPLKVNLLWGIARNRKRRLNSYGIERIGDIAFSSLKLLKKIFGPREGEVIWRMARGEESSQIIDKEELKKNVGYMHTFPKASLRFDEIWGELQRGVDIISYRLRKHRMKCRYIYIWLRKQKTIHAHGETDLNCSLQIQESNSLVNLNRLIFKRVQPLFERVIKDEIAIRGIGVYASELKPAYNFQFNLFDPGLIEEDLLNKSLDRIKNKHGFTKIILANELEFVKGRTHFVDRS